MKKKSIISCIKELEKELGEKNSFNGPKKIKSEGLNILENVMLSAKFKKLKLSYWGGGNFLTPINLIVFFKCNCYYTVLDDGFYFTIEKKQKITVDCLVKKSLNNTDENINIGHALNILNLLESKYPLSKELKEIIDLYKPYF